jgi:hypothetical protein
VVVDGGAGKLELGLVELTAESAGFFLPQLNQLVLGILDPLPVWQPVSDKAEMHRAAATISDVRRRLWRIIHASFP